MASKILVNLRPSLTRVAFLENQELRDLLIERKGDQSSLVGNIYLGKVMRILPGMQAAFVDIGLDRAAFLYVGDVRPDISPESGMIYAQEDPETSEILESEAEEAVEDRTPIQDLLKEKQNILVQVAKDPIGTKGARITTHISMPGRFVVLMPTVYHVGISRKIENEEERERLRQLVEEAKPEQCGIIVRTAAEGASADSLKNDVDYLSKVYKEIQRTYEKRKTLGLIRSELETELRAIRDLATEEVEEIWIDNHDSFKKANKFANQFLPRIKNKIFFYDKEEPLFDAYNIELEISRSIGRKIWLKSGGYIIIDEAEALVAIDVNTGSFVGKSDLEDTILKTNLEAVKEIAHQLRIRNCGGIIIIDLIDMEKEVNREMVMTQLFEELKKDRARTSVSGMSGLGLVEMTRKRTQPSLVKSLCTPCSYCDGRGYTKRESTVANEIFRQLEREGFNSNVTKSIVQCHSKVADWVYEEGNQLLDYIELKLQRSVFFEVENQYHIEKFSIENQG